MTKRSGPLFTEEESLAIIEAERTPTPEETKEHTKQLIDLIRYASGIMANKLRKAGSHEQRA